MIYVFVIVFQPEAWLSSKYLLSPLQPMTSCSSNNLSISITPIIYQFIHLFIHYSFYLFIHLSVYLSIHLFPYVSIHLSLNVSIYPSISNVSNHLSPMYPSIYLSMHHSNSPLTYVSVYYLPISDHALVLQPGVASLTPWDKCLSQS